MTTPLNYQPRNSAVYYTPPSHVDIGRTIVGCLITAIAIIIGSVLYAKIQPSLHGIYVRLGEVFVGALAVGFLAMIPVDYGKVRIPLLAAFIGAGLAMLAVYFMWLVWVHDYIQQGIPIGYGMLLKHPLVLTHLIRLINGVGAWTLHGEVVRGFPLAIFWLGEFAAILACGVLLPLKAIRNEEAACTSCGAPCKLVRPIARFADDRKAELVAAVENHEFDSLASHEPPGGDSAPQLSLRLLTCPRCNQTNVLTVNHITWLATRRGRTMNIRPLVNQMLVTEQEANHLKDLFKQIMDGRTAADTKPEPEATVSAEPIAAASDRALAELEPTRNRNNDDKQNNATETFNRINNDHAR